MNNSYNPDVLSCLANLSSDEVFTSPELVNQMLDLLPQELFKSLDTKFLDPFVKSGVFLREIAKRLIKGLEDKIPDLQERVDHIFKNQLFGIAITELTSLLARRSLYCSKYPNSKFSISKFDNIEGNIRFRRIDHKWVNKKCEFCGASKDSLDRGEDMETHAYEFIHTNHPERIFNMKFDVVIGNPPYQLGFGIEGGNSSNAQSIYNLFIDSAIKLNPKYICMIVPSRWMTKTAQGIPESWVEKMINSNKFKIIHDFESVDSCFPGITLSGGVNYFLWEKSFSGKCDYYYHYSDNKTVKTRFDYLNSLGADIVIRKPFDFSLIEKIVKVEGEYYKDSKRNFSGIVSPKHFFDDSVLLTSNWHDYKDKKDAKYNIKYYYNIKQVRFEGYISDDQLPKNKETKNLHKVFIPAANGSETIILGKPFYGEPNSVCSQTFLVIGFDPKNCLTTKEQCDNLISYIETKFFRYLVSIKKKTQNGPRGVYQFVPMQDFNKKWTDELLYKKYNLSEDEINVIEESIRTFTEKDE